MNSIQPKTYRVTITHDDNGYIILGREIPAQSERSAKQTAWNMAESIYGKLPYNITTACKLIHDVIPLTPDGCIFGCNRASYRGGFCIKCWDQEHD